MGQNASCLAPLVTNLEKTGCWSNAERPKPPREQEDHPEPEGNTAIGPPSRNRPLGAGVAPPPGGEPNQSVKSHVAGQRLQKTKKTTRLQGFFCVGFPVYTRIDRHKGGPRSSARVQELDRFSASISMRQTRISSGIRRLWVRSKRIWRSSSATPCYSRYGCLRWYSFSSCRASTPNCFS